MIIMIIKQTALVLYIIQLVSFGARVDFIVVQDLNVIKMATAVLRKQISP